MSGSFRVVWNRRASQIELTNMLISCHENGESMIPIADAVAKIGELLSQNPQTRGESRPNFQRILTVMPLTVYFEIHEEEGIVYIIRVHYTPKRRKG